MNLHQLRVVSWDVDGTLYSLPRMKLALLQLCIARLSSRYALQSWREFILLQQFQRNMLQVRATGGVLGCRDLPADRTELITIEERWYGKAIQRVGVRPGVIELIDRFRKAGLQQVVVSDYISTYKLGVLGLNNVFDASYAGETLGCIKPSPRLFHALTNDLNVDPKCVLHIGDRADRDGAAALAAGCQVVILGKQFRTPEHLLAALS